VSTDEESRTWLPAKLPMALLIVVLLLGVGLRICIFEAELARSPDERVYTRQADVVLAQGVEGFHQLGDELARDPAAVAIYPSPMRIGYLLPLVGFMRLTEDSSVLAGATFSLLCSMATLLLVAFAADRFLSRTVAIIATLFLAVLPFDLVVSRRAWEESYISLLIVSVLTLAAWLARRTTARGLPEIAAYVAFALLGVACLTTKESAGAALLLCAGGLALHLFVRGERRAALLTAVSTSVAVLAYALALGSLFGGMGHALILTREDIHYSGINPYNMQYDSGPAWMFAAALLRTSPFVCVFGLAGFCVTLYRAWPPHALAGASRLRTAVAGAGLPMGIALLTFAALLLQVLTQRYSFRYTGPAYGAACLLAAVGATAAAGPLRKLCGRWTWAVLGCVIALAAFRDVSFARERFLLPQMQDLALRPVLGIAPLPLPQATPVAAATSAADLEALVRTQPTAANRINLSLAYINGGRPAEAIPVLNAVVAEDQGDSVAWNNLCVARTMLKEYDEAITDCNRALSIAPDFQLAANNLHWAQQEQAKAR